MPPTEPQPPRTAHPPHAEGGARGGDGLVAANGPDLQTLERELALAREIVFDLRNPVGAARMAVQMLHGPLRKLLTRLDARDRVTVESVLSALDTSTQELCQAVGRLGTNPTTGHRRSPPAARKTPPAAPGAASAGASPQPAAAARPTPAPAPGPAPAPAAVVPLPTRPSPPAAPAERGVDVDELLSRLEVMMVTRSELPALLAVSGDGELRVELPGPDLLRALGYLVDNALEALAKTNPTGAPWTVDVRAYADPQEVLGDELDVVIEIADRGAGPSSAVQTWLVAPLGERGAPSPKQDHPHGRGLQFTRRLVERHGGTLQVVRRGDQTIARIRLPSAASSKK